MEIVQDFSLDSIELETNRLPIFVDDAIEVIESPFFRGETFNQIA